MSKNNICIYGGGSGGTSNWGGALPSAVRGDVVYVVKK